MPTIGPLELIIILVIALIIIGPGRLPDVGAALGKSIREFRKASSDVAEATRIDAAPPAATAPTAPTAAPAPPAPPAAPPTVSAPAVPPTPPSDQASRPES